MRLILYAGMYQVIEPVYAPLKSTGTWDGYIHTVT